MIWDVVASLGTLGAAVIAGVAALIAARASAHSAALVDLERARDRDAELEKSSIHARRIVVSVSGAGNVDLGGTDSFMQVSNVGADPVFRVMLRLTYSGRRWGPVRIGPLAPGQSIKAFCHFDEIAESLLPQGDVLITDVLGKVWLVGRRGSVDQMDPVELDRWTEEAEAFEKPQPGRNVFAKGMVYGVTDLADFHTWHVDMLKKIGVPDWDHFRELRRSDRAAITDDGGRATGSESL